MPQYRYIAIDAGNGRRHRGELSAHSSYHVREVIRDSGLLPTRITELGRPTHRTDALVGRARLLLTRFRQDQNLIEFYESLGTLMFSGVTVGAGLDLLASGRTKAESRFSRVADAMSERVKQGMPLANAMAEHPDWFGEVDRAIIHSASQNGETDEALLDLARHHAGRAHLQSTIASTLAYPMLLLVVGLGVVIFLSTVTLPQLAVTIKSSGNELPAITEGLLVFGTFVRDHWMLASLLSFGISYGAVVYYRSDRMALVRLRIPLVGRVILRSQIAGLSLLLARLLRSGLMLSESLELAVPTVPNAALRNSLEKLGGHLSEGGRVGEYLRGEGLFEPVFCRVIQVGDESGELETTLRRIGQRYRESAERLTDRLAGVLEPAAILTLAFLIGLIAYAAIVPMLKLPQTL